MREKQKNRPLGDWLKFEELVEDVRTIFQHQTDLLYPRPEQRKTLILYGG